MDPAPPDLGLLSGRYRLGSLLGRGGMADVYDGFDERLARPVAIKILRPSGVDDPAMRARFEREARAVARLSHPAVVAVFDSGEDRGRAYLVMERLPGETLADRIRIGPVDGRWLVPVLEDVLGALGAAHALGMVHRDIKPANILLVDDGRAKVADFGIAKIYQDLGTGDQPGEDLTATGLILGTVAYLSPEQIGGAPASPQADIYAVGVVAYEALAGRKPFVGEDAIAQARAVAEGRTTDLVAGRPDVDPRLAAVVRRAMARRVEDRYASAAAMLADLVAVGVTMGAAPAPDDTVLVPLPTQATVAMPPPAAPAATAPIRRAEPTRILAAPVAPGPAEVPGGRPPPPAGGRGRAGLIGALITLGVLVVAAAVVAVLLARGGTPKTIPPASTVPVTTTPTTAAPTTTATTTPTTLATTTTVTTTPTTLAPTTTVTTTPTTLAPTTTAPAPTTTTPTTPTTSVPSTPTSTAATTAAGPGHSGTAPGHGKGHRHG
jgi:tRNA A-37 threonylcarbamoyl transferase component Bud32